MDRLEAPEPLNLVGNLSDNFIRWRQKFEIYQVASGLDTKSRKVQSMTLLHIIGSEAVEIYNTFEFRADECTQHCKIRENFHTVDCLLQKFEKYCNPRKNVTIERHVFFNRNQSEGESFDSFLTDLKLKSRSCEFGPLRHSLIKDRIVGGIKSDKVRQALLKEYDLDLEKAERICRASETAENQLAIMNDDIEKLSVNNLKFQNTNSKKSNGEDSCKFCGRSHRFGKCPAYGKVCAKCKKRNHFANVCLSKSVNEIEEEKEVKAINDKDIGDAEKFENDFGSSDETNEGAFFIGAVSNDKSCREWSSVVAIGNHKITFTLDTGAQTNILPYGLFKRIQHGPIQKSNARLTTYSGEALPVVGKCSLFCEVKGKNQTLEFQIVDVSSKPILGLAACQSLDLIQLVDVIEDDTLKPYKDVFEGLGNMDDTYHICIDKNIPPVVHAPRKVPAALRDQLQAELKRMEAMDVIEKVDHPTDWVNSLVIVEKKSSGGLRLCLDPRDLNKAIKREHYKLKTIEEIVSRQSGNQVFSVLDANSAFWQIRLDDESKDFTTFNTPFGRYRFMRLPFGLNSSAEVFAKRFSQAFEDIPGVESYMDELLIGGKSVEEHDQRLVAVLERARQKGIKLKPSKCSLRAEEVKFVGHVITKNGLKPDQSKIEAILNMPVPQCTKDLERFLGMINYLGKFIPQLSEITAPLRELLKQDVEWQWMKQHQDAIDKLKEMVTKSPVLVFYDVNKPVTVSCDSSKSGIGICLLQEGKPVAYGSRTMTECEQRYSQIEKELLAVVFALEHFHYYIYGKRVQVESDHKPLESILQKPLSAAPPRLQRMLLRLMKYDFDLKYTPGKQMFVSDTLSRAPLLVDAPASDDWESQVLLVMNSLPISDEMLKKFQEETRKDATLQSIKRFTQNGWPDAKQDIPEEVRAYKGFSDEISEMNEIMFKGEQIIVPKSLQKDMLRIVHEGHLGRDKCLENARSVIFWPGMSSQIVNTVTSCMICQHNMNAQQKEAINQHEIPSLPWQKLGTDLFQFDGKHYLILVDYFSNFFEISLLSGTRANDVIIHMKSHFARHGIPREVISDSGTCYKCKEFTDFATTWGFKHTVTSPKHSQSNGLAERSVQTVKSMLKKAKASKQDPYIALLQYRNSPVTSKYSPAQLLMNRNLRTKLPATNEYLKPQVPEMNRVVEAIEKKKEVQARYYNKTARKNPLPSYSNGDKVLMQLEKDGKWEKATVISEAPVPRSFLVKRQNGGGTFTRNRVMLRPLKD